VRKRGQGARVVAGLAGLVVVLAAVAAGAAQPALERYQILPEASEARYRVGETFLGEGRFNVAVGRTRDVRGVILVDRQRPARSRVGPIVVDLSTLQSDSARRDNAIRQRWLESTRFPEARFVSTEVRGAPSRYRDGQPVELEVVGDLTVRGVTRRVVWKATVRLAGPELLAQAATSVRMTDFGFQPPSILGFVRAEDDVTLELDLVARRESP
jgi:polyisoprenoid-binding protein YceI